jgi:hypothetical protein
MRVLGELPSIDINLSDMRIQDVVSLVLSIPLPESPPPIEDEDDWEKVGVAF